MAATVLDPKTALLIIDLQNGVAGAPMAHPTGEVIRHASELATAFRLKGLPVVLVNVDGAAPGRTELKRPRPAPPAGWTDFVPELNQQPSDHVVTKRAWGAFANTGLESYLKGLGVTHVVIAGIATTVGVESTARYAYEHGFNVTLAIDAMTDRSLEAHTYSVSEIFPKLSETDTTQAIIKLL